MACHLAAIPLSQRRRDSCADPALSVDPNADRAARMEGATRRKCVRVRDLTDQHTKPVGLPALQSRDRAEKACRVRMLRR